MRDADVAANQEWEAHTLETPFAETALESSPRDEAETSALAWNESASPFAEATINEQPQSEMNRQVAELFEELRDEAFDEAVAFLAEETERDISDRFADEGPASIAERERFADSRLQEVRYETERYLDGLAEGVQSFELSSLSEQQLDEMLERYEPQPNEVTPAGEEFIRKLARKAKSAIKHVVKTAKRIGSIVNPLIGPILSKLKGFARKLLRRVLSMAIGRLPAPLQPAARALAKRFAGEAEQENEELGEGGMSPANFSDPEMLAEEFDAALAEAIVTDPAGEMEQEAFADAGETESAGSQQLLYLAEARGELIDRLAAAEPGENLAPAIEQFVPALLGALRLGVQLIGRPKVVRFLAGYVGKLIGKWVGPQLSGPLSTALVDLGMRMVTLEAEGGEPGRSEAAPVALAAVVEDTVRRLAEHEEFVFENEQLMQLAAADSFAEAISSHFPQQFVRSELQRAPTLGGAFVARRPRSLRSYRKFTRAPEVQVTAQMADALPAFGGTTVGAAVRALGGTFPIRARMHIFQVAPGTTLAAIGRSERAAGTGAPIAPGGFFPLTPQAAGTLLSEPRLGAQVPRRFLRSSRRVAAGQRVYFLEPTGSASLALDEARPTDRDALARLAPSRAWVAINYAKGRITLGLYISEAEAQKIATAVRGGGGSAPLLRAILQAGRSIGVSTAPRLAQSEDQEEFEEEEFSAGGIRRWMPRPFGKLIRRRIAAWALPALAKWTRENTSAFVQAAMDPAAGVTVRVKLSAIPGFDVLRQLRGGRPGAGGATSLINALKGTPQLSISVTAGRRRK